MGAKAQYDDYWTLGDTTIVDFNTSGDQFSASPHFRGINIGSTYANVNVVENGCGSYGGGNPPPVVSACQIPASETTQAVRQTLVAIGAPTTTDYLQTLVSIPVQSSVGDNGAAIDEAENATGTDSCWFSGSSYPPFTSVSGGHWIVGQITPGFPESQVVIPSAGQWGPDIIGWIPAAVR